MADKFCYCVLQMHKIDSCRGGEWDKAKSTKLIMLKPMLQRHAWKDKGQVLEKICVNAHLYTKRVVGQTSRDLGDFNSISFLFSRGVHNHMWERFFLRVKLFSSALRSRPGLVCYCLSWCLPFCTDAHDSQYLRGGNTSSSLVLSAVLSLLHLAWLLP